MNKLYPAIAIIATIGVALALTTVYAEDTVTSGTLLTSTQNRSLGPGNGVKHAINLQADTNGYIRATLTDVRGTIRRVTVVPGSGSYQPDEDFDIALIDPTGFDVLVGNSANLTSATQTTFVPVISSTFPVTALGTLSFSADNMGTTNSLLLELNVDEKF